MSLRITLPQKAKREKERAEVALSEGSFGMPNCKMSEAK